MFEYIILLHRLVRVEFIILSNLNTMQIKRIVSIYFLVVLEVD